MDPFLFSPPSRSGVVSSILHKRGEDEDLPQFTGLVTGGVGHQSLAISVSQIMNYYEGTDVFHLVGKCGNFFLKKIIGKWKAWKFCCHVND